MHEIESIANQLAGQKIPLGHGVRIDRDRETLTLWVLHWGRYRAVHDHHHIGIARIEELNGKFIVQWFTGTSQTHGAENEFDTPEELLESVKKAIANRTSFDIDVTQMSQAIRDRQNDK